MRLWHKDLIPYLPRQQLLGQWRECCCIAKNIAEKGTPNHILVNKIMDYPIEHFEAYCTLVILTMRKRGYKIDTERLYQYSRINSLNVNLKHTNSIVDTKNIFQNWHNYHYMLQCFYNLQEKYDCGSVPEEEWKIFSAGFDKLFY